MLLTLRSRAIAWIAVLGVGLSGAVHGTAAPPPAAGSPPGPGKTRLVTLITGDRVILRDGSLPSGIEPGPGRKHVVFNTVQVKDRVYVYPSDVQRQVVSGRLDKRLFDVTGLVKAGYDDASATTIPVLVTYSASAKKRSALPGAVVSRQLPIVNGAAMKVDKAKAAGFLTGAGAARSAAGVDKIWLDGKRRPTLDVSVPQIGAPTAWQAGYTGKGVKVAVLDTGIDTTHPDLVTQVAERKNFTTEQELDAVGHGTHVASTIAGTGAASGGKYKGVAPDAKLYDGKVCVADGCPESAILAGMEWAATEIEAGVVNVSLGGPDTPELDPLEAAVNRLTARTGTLFVVAAGNEGAFGEETVGSPGSADAALTVGAVDKQDRLAYFSSRGPRVGDGAVKPDVTAPGVDIVAAKAKDAVVGDPVGDRYLTLSGTSMATPHTAGAAALLAEQHPQWKADELKGVLTASAKPAADQTAYQQGAGRIDLAKGIEQTVVSEPGNVSFGTALWPHDDDKPVIRTVTYRNLGDKPVTLSLAAALDGPDGKPAPAGSLQLSADKVTVPANGTALIQATSNTNHDGPVGAYSGRLTATAGDVRVTSAIGVNKEPERYNLKVKAIGLKGEPIAPTGMLYRAGDWDATLFGDGSQEVTFRLSKDEYVLHNLQFVPNGTEPGQGSYYWVVQPRVQLTEDTTVVFDSRTAKPVKVSVPNPEAKTVSAAVGYFRPLIAPGFDFNWVLESVQFGKLFTAQLGPELPTDKLTSFVTSQWAKPAGDGTFDNSPWLYTQLDRVPGRMMTGFERKVRSQDLAELRQQINASGNGKVWRWVIGDAPDITPLEFLTLPVRYDQPTAAKVLVDAKAGRWLTAVAEIAPSDPNAIVTLISSPLRDYRPGRVYRERLNAAAFGTAPDIVARINRDDGDQLVFTAYGLMDGDGNRGDTAIDSGFSKLLRDGKVVAENDRWAHLSYFDVPAEKAQYTFQTSQTRESFSGFSTRTDLSWTFTSERGSDLVRLPMLGVGYRPDVDKFNVAARTPTTVLPVFLAGQLEYGPEPALPLPKIRSVSVQVSGDDGKTWQPARVVQSSNSEYKAVFATPKDAKAVSLKTQVVDVDDNVTEQTTIKAYPLG